MEHYGALCDVTTRYRMLQKHCRSLGTLQERYGALTECYKTVTENIDFAHH